MGKKGKDNANYPPSQERKEEQIIEVRIFGGFLLFSIRRLSKETGSLAPVVDKKSTSFEDKILQGLTLCVTLGMLWCFKILSVIQLHWDWLEPII